jgi:hypothetical protein
MWRHNSMISRQRLQRNAYWLFLGLTVCALVLPVPLLNAQSASQGSTKPVPQSVQTPQQVVVDNPRPDFARADRNKDGFVDKSEAGTVPGLSANFERVDRNRDGRLDRDEFDRALVKVGQK